MIREDAHVTDTSELRLREIRETDLALLFAHQQDVEANHMAGFTAQDPDDEEAFRAKMQRILADPAITSRVIEVAGQVVGNVMGFEMFGEPSVCYWIGREHWGRGHATRGLGAFLAEHPPRPLFARVAADNLGSIRVLEKCGFVVSGENVGFAHGRGAEIRELIMRLDNGTGRV
jgi:RimJ/RimL family protein N-acetyltransferase